MLDRFPNLQGAPETLYVLAVEGPIDQQGQMLKGLLGILVSLMYQKLVELLVRIHGPTSPPPLAINSRHRQALTEIKQEYPSLMRNQQFE
ncbi:MAG: hypothetical protein ACC655_02615 [Rhodothermia bacterium]